MPRKIDKEFLRVSAAVEKYLEPILCDSTTSLPLSGNAVSKALGISRDTLRRHGMLERLKAVAAMQPPETLRKGMSQQKRLRLLEQERDAARRQYSLLFEKYVTVERALLARRDIDLDEVLKVGMPKPNRSTPAGTKRSLR